MAELTDNDRSASNVVRGLVVRNENRLARRAADYERLAEALTAEDGRVFADERGLKDLYAEDVRAWASLASRSRRSSHGR